MNKKNTKSKPLLKIQVEDTYIEMPVSRENWILIRDFIDEWLEKREVQGEKQ